MKKSLKSAIIIIILVDFLGIFAIMFNQYLASLRLESINSTLIQIEYFKSNLLQLRLIANSPIIKEENSVQLFKSKISEIQHHQEELKTSLENLAVSSYSTPINDLYKSIHTYAEHFLTVSATSNAPLQDTKLLSLSRIINKQFEDLQTLLVPQIKTEYHDVLYRSLLIIAIFSSIVIIFSITNIRKLKVSLNNVNNMQKASDHEIHAYDVDELYYDEFIQMGKVIQAVVTKHALVEQEMENMLYFDELTELPNRFALSSSIEGNPSIKLMLVNINSFKSYNELYGNEVGNTILQEFAKVLKDFVKKTIIGDLPSSC
jgi:GGDEF domain-containing protein